MIRQSIWKPVLVAICCSGLVVAGSEVGRLVEDVSASLEVRRSELIEFRRDLHRNPEVSGQEERTAGRVADQLESLGFEVRREIGGHGVIGILKGALPGPLVAFRADMDAVYSNAPDPVPFRSERRGVRHICGHDLHTTTGIALAHGFAGIRDRLPGSIMLLFQPAEERATGAKAMIADGAIADPRPAAIFSLHTTPYEIGQVATASGGLMPGRDRVAISIKGQGDVEGASNRVRDLLNGLGNVGPSEAQPLGSDFILAQTSVQAGDRSPVVLATLTMASPVARQRARDSIDVGLQKLAEEFPGVEHQLDYEAKMIAGITNHPELTARSLVSARSVLGEAGVLEVTQVIPAFSEDFGSFQDEIPGVMFFLGVSNREKGWVGMPHTPEYVADEEAIFVGARVMAQIFLDFLSSQP